MSTMPRLPEADEGYLQHLSEEDVRLDAVRQRHEADGTWSPLRQARYEASKAQIQGERFQALNSPAKARAAATGMDPDVALSTFGERVPLSGGQASGRLENASTAFAGGATGMVTSAMRGDIALGPLGMLGHPEWDPRTHLVDAAEGFLGRAQPQRDPVHQGEFFADTLPSAAGSLVPLLAAGWAAAAATPVAATEAATQAAITRAVGTSGAALGASAQAGGAYEDALAHGASPETAQRAAILNAPVGVLDAALPGFAFAKPAKTVVGRVARRALAGGVEGSTEYAQALGENAIAQGLYDPEREITSTAGDQGLAGAALGFMLGGGSDRARHETGQPQPGPRTKLSPEDLQRALGETDRAVAALPPVPGGPADAPEAVAQARQLLAGLPDLGVVRATQVYAQNAADARARGDEAAAATMDAVHREARNELARRAGSPESVPAAAVAPPGPEPPPAPRAVGTFPGPFSAAEIEAEDARRKNARPPRRAPARQPSQPTIPYPEPQQVSQTQAPLFGGPLSTADVDPAVGFLEPPGFTLTPERPKPAPTGASVPPTPPATTPPVTTANPPLVTPPPEARPAEAPAPSPPAPGPASARGIIPGRESEVTLPRSRREVPVRFAVVDARDLNVSFDADMRANPAYPAGLQGRTADSDVSRLRINEMSAKLHAPLLGENQLASQGAPIVGPDLAVESGNHRTLAIRQAYAAGHESAAQYKAWLAGKAAQFGLDPQALAGVEQPVLVRVRAPGEGETAEHRNAIAEEMNDRDVGNRDALQEAKRDAQLMEGLNLTGLTSDSNGGINTAPNRPFFREFLSRVATPADLPTLLTKDGDLTTSGLARIRNAMFARVYGDSPAAMELLSKIAESTDNDVKNATAGLLGALPTILDVKSRVQAGSLHATADLAPDVLEAASKLVDLRSKGEKGAVAEYLRTVPMPGDPVTPVQRGLLALLVQQPDGRGASASSIRDALKTLAAVAVETPNPQEGGLWGALPETPKERILKSALDRLGVPDEHEASRALASVPADARAAVVPGDQPGGERARREGGRDEGEAGAATSSPAEPAGEVDPDAKFSVSQADEEIQPSRASIADVERSRQELARLTNDRVGLDFTSLLSGVGERATKGRYLRGTVTLALDQSGESLLTAARHEAVHYLKDAGLIDAKDWKLLQAVYPQRSYDLSDEESVADAFAAHLLGLGENGPETRRIFDGMRVQLERIGNWLKGRGLQTQADVFARLNARTEPSYDLEAVLAGAASGGAPPGDEPVGDGPREGDDLPALSTAAPGVRAPAPATPAPGASHIGLPDQEKLADAQLRGAGEQGSRMWWVHRFIDYVGGMGEAGRRVAEWAKRTELYRERVVNNAIADIEAAVKAAGLADAEWKRIQPHILAVVSGEDLRADIAKKRARLRALAGADPSFAKFLTEGIAAEEEAIRVLGASPADLWQKRQVATPGATFQIRWNDTQTRNARFVSHDPKTGVVRISRESLSQGRWQPHEFKDMRSFENSVVDLWTMKPNAPPSLKRLAPIVEAWRKIDDEVYRIFRSVAGTDAAGFVHRHVPHRLAARVRRLMRSASGPENHLYHGAIENLALDIVDANPHVSLADARESARAMMEMDYDDTMRPLGRRMGSFESARGPYHDPFLLDYSMSGVERYFELAATRTMEYAAWAQYVRNKTTGKVVEINGRKKIAENGSPQSRIQEYLSSNIARDPRFGPREAERAHLFIRHVLGTTERGKENKALAHAAKGLARWEYGSKLFGAGILAANIFQPLSLGALITGPVNPVLAALRHLGDVTSGRPGERARNERAGAVAATGSVMPEFTEDDDTGGKAWTAIGRFSRQLSRPFKWTERLANSISASAGFLHAKDLLSVIRQGGNVTAGRRSLSSILPLTERRPAVARRLLKETYRLTDAQVAHAERTGSFDEAAEDTIRQSAASRINFRPGQNYMPGPWTQDDAFGIAVRTFRSFSYNVIYAQAEHFKQEMFPKSGPRNIKPLISLMLAAGLSGEAIKWIKDLLRDHDRERKSDYADTKAGAIAGRFVEDLTMAGTLGLLERPADFLTIQGMTGAMGRTALTAKHFTAFLIQRPEMWGPDGRAAAAMAWATAKREVTSLREAQAVTGRVAGLVSPENRERHDTASLGTQAGWIWHEKQLSAGRGFAENLTKGAEPLPPGKWWPEAERMADAILDRDPQAAAAVRDVAVTTIAKEESLSREAAMRKLRDAVRRKAPLSMVPGDRLPEFERWMRERKGDDAAARVMALHREYMSRLDGLTGS